MSSSAIQGQIFNDPSKAADGSAASPSFSFANSTSTGVYRVSANTLGISTAGVQRVVVDASGNVGIGTASPAALLHVNRGTSGAEVLRLQGGTGAFNDPYLSFYKSDGSARNGYIQVSPTDFGLGLNGSGNITFSSNSTERMSIDASGSVTLGAVGATAGHFLRGNTVEFISVAGSQLNLYNANTKVKILFINTSDNRFYVRDADNTDGVYLAQNGTSWQSASDERLKKNIKPLELGLEEIKALQPKRFDFNTDESEDAARVGFIAQEVLPVLPHAVDVSEDPEGMMGVSPTEMIPVLVKAIQELSAKVDAQAAEIAELKAKP